MDLGTTWGHPVHDARRSCAHPVGGRSSSETSAKPLVPLAETGVELRHRRARRRAGRRRLRHRAGPGDRTREGPDEELGGTPSETAGTREATPAPRSTGRPDRRGPDDWRGSRARRRATPGRPGTAGHRETGGATGPTASTAAEEGKAGGRTTSRRRRGQPQRWRGGTAAGRTPRSAPRRAPGPPEGDLRRRRSGRPRRRRGTESHVRCSTQQVHRVHRRATSDDGAAGDRGGDGARRRAGCDADDRRRGRSGDRGRRTGRPGRRRGRAGVDGGRRCDRRTGRGDLAPARNAGDRATRRGPTDARQHRRSTLRPGQPGRRPAGCATRGPSISYIEGPRTVCATALAVDPQSARASARCPPATRPGRCEPRHAAGATPPRLRGAGPAAAA
jgi:hypothetical protein